jgi:hypothetical protein
MDLLLGELAAVGYCQPDGSFITTLADLREWLGEMAAVGEAVCVDGLATRVQRPCGWTNQKVLYDWKRHAHTAQGLALSSSWGDLLWVDGGWPGSCHEHELIELAGLDQVLDDVEVASLLDRGFRGLAKAREHWHAPVGDRRSKDRLSDAQRTFNRLQAGLRALVEQAIAHLTTPGRCAAGVGCCTASGTSTGPSARWSALAAGCTEFPHDKTITATSGEANAVTPAIPSCHSPWNARASPRRSAAGCSPSDGQWRGMGEIPREQDGC